MNRKNILKVADAIEQHSIPDLGFNMARARDTASAEFPDMSGHQCRTVSCIKGWAEALSQAEVSGGRRGDDGYHYLGLSNHVGMALFLPVRWCLGTYTPAQAVRCLRHLAETGEVRWDLALAEEPAQ